MKPGLSATDLRFVVSRIPKDVRNLMMKTPGLLLGGGFIRETIAQNKPNDVDLFAFAPSEAECKAILTLGAHKISENRQTKTYTTQNAISVFTSARMPIQFITRWTFATPEDLVDSFDFTVCQACVWFQDSHWRSLISEGFYPDLAAKRLVYTFPRREEEPGGSMLRARKFIQRGYNVQCEALAGVISRLISGVRESKQNERGGWSVFEDEKYLSKILTGLLKEVDPNVAIDGLEPIDEHQTIEELSEVAE